MINNIYFLRVPSIEELRKLKKSDLHFMRSRSCFPFDSRHMVRVDRIKEPGFLVCLFENYKQSIIVVNDIIWFDRQTLTFKGLNDSMKHYYINHFGLVMDY